MASLKHFERTIHLKKWDCSSFKNLLKTKNSEKTNPVDKRIRLITGRTDPYVISMKKSRHTNRNQLVINTDNGEKKKR